MALPVIPESMADLLVYSEDGALIYVSELAKGRKDVVSFVNTVRKRAKAAGDPPPRLRSKSADEFTKIREELRSAQPQEADPSETFRIAREMFRTASDKGASDIHILIYDRYAEVKMRVNGSLTKIQSLPAELARALLSTIYGAMADVADVTFQPTERQDARVANPEILPKGVHGIRIAYSPTVQGSMMVMRVLYDMKGISGTLEDRLTRLGYDDQQMDEIRTMANRPAGIVIVAGPTGSGKSTTLKHVLEGVQLERPDRNYMSIEDPPEYPMEGVNQIPVANASGAEARNDAFNSCIKFAMRADPDVVMIGEIRDAESGRLAARMAMTGHKVYTTLHANGAINIMQRLGDLMLSSEMPQPLNLLADNTVVVGLMFQRLLPITCDNCAEPLRIEDLEDRFRDDLRKLFSGPGDMDRIRTVNPAGCELCNHTGVSGRTVVAEVILPTRQFMEVLRERGIQAAREYWVRNMNARSIVSHAIEKIRQGQVDPVLADQEIGPLNDEGSVAIPMDEEEAV